jgi:DUF1680 family protein
MQSGRAKSNIRLEFDMPVQRVQANPKVLADVGRIALQRGPIVFCLEEEDNGANLDLICIPKSLDISAEFRADLLGGVIILKGTALKMKQRKWKARLYETERIQVQDREYREDYETKEFVAIPYYAWNNRTPGKMAVWMREINIISKDRLSW